MAKPNSYSFELSKHISHELALVTLEEIANAIETNLYSLGIMREGNLGSEFSLGRLIDEIKQMKITNKEYYELKKSLKKALS